MYTAAMIDEPDTPNWLAEVQSLCRTLRGEHGCPWDKAQTLRTMTPYLLEETYEVIDAIESGSGPDLEEELGDLLFLLVFVMELAEEGGHTDLGRVVRANLEKIRRRHPHVFGDHQASGVEQAMERWEEAKRAEKGQSTGHIMRRRPEKLPGLALGFRVGEKAASVGFEWRDWREALAKVDEEYRELREALEAGRPDAEKELGDVLFALSNLARYMRTDPERSLRGTVQRFLDRFHAMEEALKARGLTPAPEHRPLMLQLWRETRRPAGE
jgi:tetrapyrrole methylase family protein / MazG family protein